MYIGVRRLSTHAVDRLKEAYGKEIKVQALINTVVACAQRNYVSPTNEDGLYVVLPGEGVFVVKGDEIVTFTHKKRFGDSGSAKRAYELFNKKAA